MRTVALGLFLSFTACESLPAPSKEPPVRVELKDIFVGQDIHGEGAKHSFLFIKAEFIVEDPRPAVLTNLAYTLYVDNLAVGRGRAQDEIMINERRTLDFTLRKTEIAPEEAVKLFQAKGGKLSGTIQYKMITGGMYDKPFEAAKAP